DTIGESGGRLRVGGTTLSRCGGTAASTTRWNTPAQGQTGRPSGTLSPLVAAHTSAPPAGRGDIPRDTHTGAPNTDPPPPPPPARPPSRAPPPPPVRPPPPPPPRRRPPPPPRPPPPAPTPAPTPPPTPTPTPTPTPAPPAPQHVDFSGTISGLSGRCPTVTFN